jgi:hypothetical protein
VSASDSLDDDCRIVAMRMAAGKVIPFLGAAASVFDRPKEADWLRDSYLPTTPELAEYLATKYGYPAGQPRELVRVAQYADLVMRGEAALFETLHELFAGDYPPTALHRWLAAFPAKVRSEGRAAACQLIITTNFDDSLERAFEAAGEDVDVVCYFAERDEAGKFVHLRPDGKRVSIPKHTDYRQFALGERTVILKLHGAVDRVDERRDTYVITEDHYIDYLAQSSVSKRIPAQLVAKMRTSHFLFLGYGLRDWNLRVILRNIWSEQTRQYGSWAVQKKPDRIDEAFWQRHGVKIIDVGLDDWIDAMDRTTT